MCTLSQLKNWKNKRTLTSKNIENKQKTNKKLVDLNLNISIIILNANCLKLKLKDKNCQNEKKMT